MLSHLWNWTWDLCLRLPLLRRLVVRAWYEFVSVLDRGGEIRFMNYGYVGPALTDEIELDPADQVNRYQIQLYQRTAGQVDLAGRDVLEVGSGRGGGAAYVSARHRPVQMTGVDISVRAIQFCRSRYALPNLRFRVGDAEKLNFASASFDAVLNIESSAAYGDVGAFLSEVQRVLRPGGHLLYADIREAHEIPALHAAFRSAGLTLCQQEDIAPGVVRALDRDEARKVEFLKHRAPRVLHGALREFAGTKGSAKHAAFSSGQYKYLVCLLCKGPQPSTGSSRDDKTQPLELLQPAGMALPPG